MRHTYVTKTIIASSIFAMTTIAASASLASDHAKKNNLHPQAAAVDMLITGVNKGSLKLKNLPPDTINKDDCPLCYHRNLMKIRENNGVDGTPQPFPGD